MTAFYTCPECTGRAVLKKSFPGQDGMYELHCEGHCKSEEPGADVRRVAPPDLRRFVDEDNKKAVSKTDDPPSHWGKQETES